MTNRPLLILFVDGDNPLRIAAPLLVADCSLRPVAFSMSVWRLHPEWEQLAGRKRAQRRLLAISFEASQTVHLRSAAHCSPLALQQAGTPAAGGKGSCHFEVGILTHCQSHRYNPATAVDSFLYCFAFKASNFVTSCALHVCKKNLEAQACGQCCGKPHFE